MNEQEFLPYLDAAFAENGVSAGEREKMLLTRFAVHLTEVNETFNLTAITAPEKVALLHMTDVALAAAAFPPGARVLDVGCGGGFPTLPLAILRPDLEVTALDATAKKTAFVTQTAALLGLTNVTVCTGRAEDKAQKWRERFDVVTARAVAALPVLAELCLPYVRVGGLFVAMKGKNAAAELAEAAHALEVLGGQVEDVVQTPLFAGEEQFARAEIRVKKVRPTPPRYPRAFGQIKKKPL